MLESRYQPALLVRISHAFGERRSEWIAAAQCILLGLVLLAPTRTFDSPAFVVFQQLASENVWGAGLLLVGAVRLAGLIINGARRRVTPWIRLSGAWIGCGVFTTMSLCFASGGSVSTWIAAWPVAAVVEVINIYYTARDARVAHRR